MTAIPTLFSPRGSGDTEVLRDEDSPRGRLGQELSQTFQTLEFSKLTHFIWFFNVLYIGNKHFNHIECSLTLSVHEKSPPTEIDDKVAAFSTPSLSNTKTKSGEFECEYFYFSNKLSDYMLWVVEFLLIKTEETRYVSPEN